MLHLLGLIDRRFVIGLYEKQIFLLLAEGRFIKQAAFDLGLSPKTVETYKYRLMRKLNIDNVVDLAKMAIRTRLVQP